MVYQSKTNQPLILTFGYGNRKNYDDFLKYLELFHVNCVVDIRLIPRAWSRKWYGQEIEKLCYSKNIKYIAKATLGNTSGKSNWVPPDEKEALNALLEISEISMTTTTLLLCAELQHTRCHRVDVAQQLSKLTNTPVKHLE